MLSLSTRAKEAIKTGLAVTIVYWVALSFDWLNPHWAVIAVAMVSLPTAGQSLNKGVLRVLGTIIGAAAALLFLALFPQERWAFMACVSIYVGACTYLMTGKRHQYFWQVEFILQLDYLIKIIILTLTSINNLLLIFLLMLIAKARLYLN